MSSTYKKRISVMKIMSASGVILMLAGFGIASVTGFNETNMKLAILGLLILVLGVAAYMLRKASWNE